MSFQPLLGNLVEMSAKLRREAQKLAKVALRQTHEMAAVDRADIRGTTSVPQQGEFAEDIAGAQRYHSVVQDDFQAACGDEIHRLADSPFLNHQFARQGDLRLQPLANQKT